MNKTEAWIQAAALVQPIVDQHGITEQKLGGGMFMNATTAHTPVSQHLEHIVNIADWLLDEEE